MNQDPNVAQKSARAVLIALFILIVTVTMALADEVIGGLTPIDGSLAIDPAHSELVGQQFTWPHESSSLHLGLITVELSTTQSTNVQAEVYMDDGSGTPDWNLVMTTTRLSTLPTDGNMYPVQFEINVTPYNMGNNAQDAKFWFVLRGDSSAEPVFYWANTNSAIAGLNYYGCQDDTKAGCNSITANTWVSFTNGSPTQLLQINLTTKPTAVTLSSFQASAPPFDPSLWLRQFLGR